MTIIRTEFDYPAQIRRRGHRKTEKVAVRETAAFEIPDYAAAEAPVAMRLRSDAVARPISDGAVRFVQDALFAPVRVGNEGNGQLAAADFGPASAKLHTELTETPIEAAFLRLPHALPVIRNIVDEGHHPISNERAEYHADACRRAQDTLIAIDGVLHMRIPEPMFVLLVNLTGKSPSIHVDFDQYPGSRISDEAGIFDSVGHFSLNRRDDAERTAAVIAERLHVDMHPTLVFGDDPDRPMRPNQPIIVDENLLRTDPLLVTQEQSIRSLLHLGHEALLHAPDEFVMSWADMRESLSLIESGHADAAIMATDSIRNFLAHAPAGDQFATGADRRRWASRTLPLLQARLISIDILSGMRNLSNTPEP